MAVDPLTRADRKMLPPTPVSKSLEGLEIGIPPIKFTNPWLSKPLPKLPDRTSSLYSRESLIDSYMNRPATSDSPASHKKATSESHQEGRFYRRRNSCSRNSMARINGQANRCSLTLRTFLSEEQYGIGMYLARPATSNHYFREKKWEIFPELAPQSSAQNPQTVTKSRKRRGLKRKRSQARSHHKPNFSSSENLSLNLRPIADYMQQTLAKKTSQLRLRKKTSQTSTPATARPLNGSSSSADSGILSVSRDRNNGNPETQHSMRRHMREISFWGTRVDSSEESLHLDENELAWKGDKEHITSPRWRSPLTKFHSPSSTKLHSRETPAIGCYDSSSSIETPRCGDKKLLLSDSNHSQSSLVSLPEYAKALQQKTSHVFLAIEGVKNKLTEARAARRRAQLKKHIRLIGPIENYPYGAPNEWL
ncbi:hypothetical protein BGW36DRAFT_454680 [Talaromyces proteolyticus]|uniref:Uncharacterized protein n=1 Tax=Talaromyces proteolyticus TaxID=1131652 RepID=A0AAD4KL80_9EURO|nr:uncharacterized protein BGW36DRAFT_454680 [Talaromyces proteolyticus]KAH8694122.1 hypothetical protein BGW36DRAFT_454680 [Talaromyces proteolyticus]